MAKTAENKPAETPVTVAKGSCFATHPEPELSRAEPENGDRACGTNAPWCGPARCRRGDDR